MTAGALRRVADPTDSDAVKERFIATYGTASEELDSQALVAQYQRVQEYAAAHPEQGSAAVATALDLPRYRLRSWVDGDGRPDAVRGLERLRARGWVDFDWDDARLLAMAGLVTWIVAGGSIEKRGWAPAWSAAPGTAGDLRRLGEPVGIDWQDRHTGHVRQGTEWVADRDGSILGRLLGVLGAPVGEGSGPALPTWIVHDECPRALKLDMARIIVRQRGTALEDRPGRPIQIQLSEPGRRRVVVDLFHDLLGTEGAVHVGDGPLVRLDARAAELLGAPPTVGQPLPKCE